MAASAQPFYSKGPTKKITATPLTKAVDPNNTVVGATGGAATLSIPADAGQVQGEGTSGGPVGPANPRPICLPEFFYSYSGAPAAGTLVTIQDGSNVIWQEFASVAGPRTVHFDRPLRGTPGNAMTITAAGSAGVQASVSAPGVFVELE